MKKIKTIVTALLLLITLYIPLSCTRQSKDFEMEAVLVKYNGNAANVTIPKGVTAIGDWAFYWCENLTSVTIPSSVTSIGFVAFSGKNLTSITIPSSVTSIGDNAFERCSSLASITIPSSVTSIGDNAFFDCSSLTSIIVDSQNPAYSSVDGVLFNKYIADLVAYPAGKQESTYTIPSSVISIGNSAFSWCESLTSVTIPSSVISIGDWAFNGCESLTAITIPSSVISIGNSAFYWCESLTSVTIPSSVISIENNAFSGCNSLTSIIVDSQNPAYSSVDGVLFNKYITNLVAYPAGKQESTYTIPSSVTSIGDWAFDDRSSLTSIIIPSSVTSIGVNAFSDCSSLTSIIVDSQNPAYSSVDGVLFNKYITNLVAYPVGKQESTYTIPSSVISIGDNAFSNCSSLTSITIPSSVTSIGNWAFSGCSRLIGVWVSRKTRIGKNAFFDNTQIMYYSD